ncbi:MAG TPA: hypothetical protein VHT91_09780 [Kofleriaceae bacterium]|nr:hypothetical protein [Kofleriaceae bacterium]
MGIARNQRRILLVLLAYLVAGWLASAAASPGANMGSQLAFGLVALCTVIASLVFAVRMANALHGPGTAVLYVVLLLVPLVNLIALLVLNGRATRELKAAGLNVGFLGVTSSELDAWASRRLPQGRVIPR